LAQARHSARARQQALAHDKEVAVLRLQHQLDLVREPLEREYQLDLAALYRECAAAGRLEERKAPPAPSDQGAPLPPEEEVAELRRKLAKLGGVNLEAIDELRELEARHTNLQVQFDDLTASQRTLQDIIERINTDSRRLFTETFEAIKAHFQELFRKLFGGGMADVVLEEGADVLEGGIEIVARPPGNELRGISLMS